MLDSPIKWVGGKSRLRGEVIARLPREAECYCEVFAGAAWVLFGKRPHPVEVLNDSNGDLINLWRVFKWRKAELLEEVQQWLYSRELFLELRANRPSGSDELERAVWMYLMIQMSFGADLSRTQSASFGFRNRSRGDLFLNKSRDQFRLADGRLDGVFIECSDFETCVCRYDQPQTIFYCDPPYYSTTGYSEKFTADDHERLAKLLGDIEGRFLLTVDDCPATRDLYGGFHVETAEESRSLARDLSGRQPAPILFVSNYRTVIAPVEDNDAEDAPRQLGLPFITAEAVA